MEKTSHFIYYKHIITDKNSNVHMFFYPFVGSDGYQADYIKIYTDTGAYTCYFSKFLDDDDSEMGHGCVSF